MRLAFAFQKVRDFVDAEMAEQGNGLVPGFAFDCWVTEMRKWAKRHGYKYGASNKKRERHSLPSSTRSI